MPAAPWAQTAVQPDGSTVTYRVYGDEDFSYYATESGLLLQRDPETKALCFVEGGPESGFALGASASDAVAATDRYAVVDDLGSDRAKASYSALAGAEYGTGVSKDFTLLSKNASQVATYGLSRSNAGTLPSSIPLLAIVVGFDDLSEKNDDTPYRDDYDWTETLFEDQYSTQKYWSDASNGSFTFTPAAESSSHGTDGNTNASDAANDGVVHVTIPRAHGNWGGDHIGDEDFIETLSLACDEARSYVDFGAFDKNGNGLIENDELAVTFILAGYEASTGAETEKHVWAHANSDVEISTDPVNINRYIVMGETERMQSSSGTMLERQGGSGSAVMGSGNVTLLDAGDAVQGNALATLIKGDGVVSAMTATGYDLAIAGNHEFDYGLDQLKMLVSKAKKGGIKYLGANIDSLPTNDLLFGKGSSIETYLIGGKEVQIGFVGITTPESLTKSRPANFQDENGTTIVGFCQDETGEALYKRVQEQVDKLKVEGVDHVVAIGHLGNVGVTPRWSSEAVIANTTGIDVVIDGHSHESYNKRIANKDGADTLLVQTGSNLAAIGELTLDASGTFTAELIALEDYTKKDAQVQEKLVSHQGEFEELLNEELGTSEVDMPWESDEGIRLATIGETNLGDLIADAYRVRMGADIGLTNAGGIRGPIDEGTLMYGELLTVQPFNSNICVIEATGQEIIDALEMGAAVYPDSSNKLLQVSGLSYAIDPDVKSTVVVDEKGSFVRVDGQRRVCDVKVGGQPIDLGATYTVASHTFLLRDGGDGMSMFVDNDAVVDEGITDIQALIDYVSQDLGGVIGAGYENAAGAGRITEADASVDGDDGGFGGSDGSGGGQDANPASGDQGNGTDPIDGESAAGEGDGLPSTGDEGRSIIAFAALAIVASLVALRVVYARRGR